MTYPEAKQMLTGLLDAFDRDEHGDYFYDHGWEVCEAVSLAMGAFEDKKVVKTNADGIRYMNDEELAKWLTQFIELTLEANDLCGTFEVANTFEADLLNQLKQPYKEDT